MPGKKKPGTGVKDDAVHKSTRDEGGSKAGRRGDQAGSYDDWTVEDLRKRAKELGLSGYSGKKKPAVLSLLRDH